MKHSRYPIATNISATSGTDSLLGLKDGKTRNFKVSDIVNLAISNVYLSAQDITSESINVGLTSGNLQWNRISDVPVASSATSGVLSVQDYNRFLSGSNNTNNVSITSATLNFGNGISATSLYISANPSVGLTSIVTSGTSTKISYDQYGRIVSGQNITSSDIPTIPPSKISEDSNDRFVSDSQISYWNSVSAYLPLSGGTLTGNLSGTIISASELKANHIHTDYLDFNLSATPTYLTGRLHWDDNDKTLDLDLDDGTILQIGQETLIRGQNNTGSTISNGRLVYINGAAGNRPTFQLADADAVSASTVIAIATHDIPDNNTGFFTTFGIVRELNTSQFTEGEELFLSTSAGLFTNIEPAYPNKKCSVGYVVRSHASQGSIFFNTKHISKYEQSTVTPTELNSLLGIQDNIQAQIDNKLDLSGGNISGSLSANSFVDTNFVGGRVLTSNSQSISESNITNVELSYLSNLSGNIQTQLNQLSQNSLSGTGAGTVGKISKFVTSSSVGDSSITDTGSLVTFSTPITVNGDVSATTFTGLASRATSALTTDTLKTSRNFSISGDMSSNVVSFNGTGNVVLSGTISNLSPTKISQDTTHRFVTDTQINSWNTAASASINVSAIDISLTSGSLNWNRVINEPTTLSGYGISSADSLFDTKYSPILTNTIVESNSANWTIGYTSAHNHLNKSILDNINQSVNTSASVSFNTLSATNISAITLTVGNISNTEFGYLDGVSANIQTQFGNISALNSTKVDISRTITTTSGLTGGGDLSTNRIIGLVAVGTSGTYSNIMTNAYGQITSARGLISADIPTIPPSKILEDSNDRFVSDSQINYWNSLSATSFAVSSINIASTSGSLDWNRVSAVPVASTNTSGLLTSSDWNTFNNKIGSLSALSNYLPLSGGTIQGNISATNISASTLIVGNISNTEIGYLDGVSANIQTQLNTLSARTLTSADIPVLPPSKILTNENNRFVTDSQISQWDANVSGTSAIVDLEYSLILEANKNKLHFLSGATNNVASAAPNDMSFTKYLSPIYSGTREKLYTVVGPTSGIYQATVVFYGTSVNREAWIYPGNSVIATITSANNVVSASFSNKFTVWGASLTVDSGTIPSPGISATVEV